MSASSSR
jgi:hypothetical protein